MSTPHNSAEKGQFAKTVLMPGDPLRSKFIAENFLDAPVLVNNVRGVQGYTGNWKGRPVSVMASGMGIPSIGIYSYELYNFYGVENIIRVGSAGGIDEGLELMDIVLGMGACTNSDFAAQYRLPGTPSPIAAFSLLRKAAELGESRGLNMRVGNLLSTDCFYNDDKTAMDKWKGMGVLAVEMEAAGLYLTAQRAGKNALCICTISDHIYKPEELSASQRQTGFADMIELALDTAAALD